MTFKAFFTEQAQKSRRSIDIGDYVYIEPSSTTFKNASKDSKLRAGEIGKCIARKDFTQSRIFRIKFDDQHECNVPSAYARKVTENDYTALKEGKLNILTKQQIVQNKQKKSRDLLFAQLAKLKLTVTTDTTGLRQCEFDSKYNKKINTFFIKETVEEQGNKIVCLLPCTYMRDEWLPGPLGGIQVGVNNLYINYLACEFNTSYYNTLTRSKINSVISTIKHYLQSNYTIGCNKIDNSYVTLNSEYRLDSVDDKPAVITNAKHDELIWFKNGQLHRENGHAYVLKGTSFNFYAYNDKVFKDFQNFENYKINYKLRQKMSQQKDTIFDDNFLAEF